MEKRKVLIDFCEWCNENNKYDFIYKSIIDEYLQSINSIDEQQEKEICHEYDRMNPCWSFDESGISGCTDCPAYNRKMKYKC
jgi:hypothetical protein